MSCCPERTLTAVVPTQALLAAANLLDVMAVREACCRFMERQMDEMNCVGIHCFAEAHSCKVLEKRSMDYILEHFSSVYQQVLISSDLTDPLLFTLCDGPQELLALFSFSTCV